MYFTHSTHEYTTHTLILGVGFMFLLYHNLFVFHMLSNVVKLNNMLKMYRMLFNQTIQLGSNFTNYSPDVFMSVEVKRYSR